MTLHRAVFYRYGDKMKSVIWKFEIIVSGIKEVKIN